MNGLNVAVSSPFWLCVQCRCCQRRTALAWRHIVRIFDSKFIDHGSSFLDPLPQGLTVSKKFKPLIERELGVSSLGQRGGIIHESQFKFHKQVA